jgi:hypothetical protein
MFDQNKRFEKINKNICKIMDSDLDAMGFAFFDEEGAMEIPDLYEFCKWWVKKYPDKFIKLKGKLYDFRKDRAQLFGSIQALSNINKDEKRLSPFTLFQMQLLTNNCIDQTNSTCQLIQSLVRMCENILKGQ